MRPAEVHVVDSAGVAPLRPPYFTGKMKLIDTAGRVDKFRTRYEKKGKK